MLGERRGREDFGRAITCAIEEVVNAMQPREEASPYRGVRKDGVATAAVLLAIVVSLAGACVVIIESTAEPPVHKHLTIATAE
jgi:hypothetical protein